jgi:hypothetical protein
MKKFEEAYSYYKKIKDYSEIDNNNIILTLFYSKNLRDIVDIKSIQKELKTFNLDKEEEFYYNNSLDCLNDFHICKKKFNIFFSENKNIKNQNLMRIKTAINNYRNFKIEELYYKNALIT